jgi:hypothetical protein
MRARSRLFPDAPLRAPVRRFEDTFSAVDCVADPFHLRKEEKPVRLTAAIPSSTDR